MKPIIKTGLATLLVVTAAISLSTAGTPNVLVGSPRALQAQPTAGTVVTSAQDSTPAAPAVGSPKGQTQSDSKATASAHEKCGMDHSAKAKADCCAPASAPAHAHKAACCG